MYRPSIHVTACFIGALAVAAALFAAVSFEGSGRAESCDPAYPDFCIPVGAPDQNCVDMPQRNFQVLPPDPHELDDDDDGIGCDDPSGTAYPKRNLAKRAWAPMVACDTCQPPSSPSPTPTKTSAATATSATPTSTATPTATPTRTATPSPTPTQLTCGAAQATITGLNKGGTPETVTVSGNGLLTGWYLISENGNQRFDFPAGYVLNGTVTIQSGPGAANNPPSVLFWSSTNLWNNSTDDDAFLYDCAGALRSSFEDGD